MIFALAALGFIRRLLSLVGIIFIVGMIFIIFTPKD